MDYDFCTDLTWDMMRTKQIGGLLLREKQARQLSTRLKKPLTAQRRSHRLIESSNHWTRNFSNRSRIWSAAGWCPAAIIAKQMQSRIMQCYNNSETAVYGYNPALFWIVSVLCWCLAKLMFTWHDRYCSILLAEFKMSTCYLCWPGLCRSYVLRHIRLGSFAVLRG